MSIRFQCCGIAILLILAFFLGRRRKIYLLTARVFRMMVYGALVCLALDVGSIMAISAAFPLSGPAQGGLWVDLVCKLYLMTLPMMGVLSLFYIYADSDPDFIFRRGKMRLHMLLLLAGWLLILLAPIRYAKSPEGQVMFTTGPSVYATFCLIALYLLLITQRMIRNRKQLNRRRRLAVSIWLFIWIGLFLIQTLNNRLLVAGLACALGILIVYLSMENPEANFDRQTGLLTRSFLASYLRQLYGQSQQFTALVLLLRATPAPQLNRSSEEVRMDLFRFLEAQRDWPVFKEREDRIYLLFSAPDQALEARQTIMKYYRQRWRYIEGLPIALQWLHMPQAQLAGSLEELLFLVDYAWRKYLPETELVTLDDAFLQEVNLERALERKLSAAIAKNQVEVFFQPIYSTVRKTIASAEALVRVRDVDGEPIAPGMFIPIAERTGLIIPLGRMIFEKVCLFIHDHPLESLGLDYIEVNLSLVQCSNPDMATEYIDIMRRFSVAPERINLEITESASVDAKKLLKNTMDQLIACGVSFSLDDFGTGQSNLNYIMDLPVQLIKFDRGMTQAYFVSSRARQVMNAAIHMIHNMGLQIVCEGIETQEQFHATRNLGIERIQGYYFAPPLPEDEFLEYLKNFQPPQ